jgi:hypothetical protein
VCVETQNIVSLSPLKKASRLDATKLMKNPLRASRLRGEDDFYIGKIKRVHAKVVREKEPEVG